MKKAKGYAEQVTEAYEIIAAKISELKKGDK